MYLVSLYFDDESTVKIQKLIHKTAAKSGNDFMIANKVPPHITISAFQGSKEEEIVKTLDCLFENKHKGDITWASVGAFKSSVLYLAPILNEYMHSLAEEIYKGVSLIDGISMSKMYLPFHWLPHTTIAKQLSREQLILGFDELSKNFNIFSGKVVRVGLSKTNPLEEIRTWKFK